MWLIQESIMGWILLKFTGAFIRAGHLLIFLRFAIRSPLNFFLWIADAHAFIFRISFFARRSNAHRSNARRSNARRSTSGSLSEKGLNHSLLSIISVSLSTYCGMLGALLGTEREKEHKKLGQKASRLNLKQWFLNLGISPPPPVWPPRCRARGVMSPYF